jgi:hypothetical protein
MARVLSRRGFIVGGAAVVGTAAAGGAAVASGVVHVPDRVRRLLDDEGPDGVIPDAPQGRVSLTTRHSAARGRDVGFWTAVPDGHGAGAGLPVCLILHGASASTASYTKFGFAKFLTAAVRAGAPPFVLAGADGALTYWKASGTDDPQRMLHEEIPSWCTDQGFDATRVAAYGWSMGGFGSLYTAEHYPGWLRGVAALSPAIGTTDEIFTDVAKLQGPQIALWCGDSDPLQPAVKELARRIDGGPAIAAWDKGAHRRVYWNRVTPAAFAFVGHALAP